MEHHNFTSSSESQLREGGKSPNFSEPHFINLQKGIEVGFIKSFKTPPDAEESTNGSISESLALSAAL